MIDCINEEVSVSEEEGDEVCEDFVNTTCPSEMEESPVKSVVKGRKQRSIRTKLPNSMCQSLQSTPSKQQLSQRQATSLLEYVVDQKGIGSESLIVKSASMIGSKSASNGSRRNSLGGAGNLSPIKSTAQNTFSPFNPNYSTPTTTQSHHLFPNYPRTLPSMETQFDFNFINADLGLTALNANDFNLLGLWNRNTGTAASIADNNNNSSYFNIYPQADIPRYTHLSSQSQFNHNNNAIPSSTSQNPINNLVSDLFGDIANMF